MARAHSLSGLPRERDGALLTTTTAAHFQSEDLGRERALNLRTLGRRWQISGESGGLGGADDRDAREFRSGQIRARIK